MFHRGSRAIEYSVCGRAEKSTFHETFRPTIAIRGQSRCGSELGLRGYAIVKLRNFPRHRGRISPRAGMAGRATVIVSDSPISLSGGGLPRRPERPPPCVPAAKPGRSSSTVSRRIVTTRRKASSFGRLDGSQAAPVLRAPVRWRRPGSSIRMRNYSVLRRGRAAHGAEPRSWRARTMPRPPWSATRWSGIRPVRKVPKPTDPQSCALRAMGGVLHLPRVGTQGPRLRSASGDALS